jgi:endonuclease/exonuclease/phosphatase family metal-dependent hydrolase
MRIRNLAAATAAAAVTLTGLSSVTPALTTEASAAGTSLRVASFNVRTARAHDARTWLSRADNVAREIVSRNPGVVALQELGPGRADGVVGTLNGTPRQTDSLLSALSRNGGGKYALVRTTPYVKAGTTHGTQGARILYDTSRYSLVSDCPETTGKAKFNPSCAMDLPTLGGDGAGMRRSAAWAELKDKSTGKQFFVVSVHLDTRHGGSDATYDALRTRQVAAVYNRVKGLAGGKEIVIAGDFNAWKTKAPSGNTGRNYLMHRGFKDTSLARKRINTNLPTINHFATTVKSYPAGKGVALDWIMAKGIRSAKRYENVTKKTDSNRPSDHSMIVSDLAL